MPQQGVDENLEVFAHGRRRDAALAGDVGTVDQLGVRKGRGGEEVRERRQVAHQALGRDFFFEVVVDVGGQAASRRVGEVVARQPTLVQGTPEVELPA